MNAPGGDGNTDMAKKILMAASSGGHLEEILALKKLKDYYETVLITEKTDYKVNCWQDKTYLMPQVNRRNIKSLFQYIGCFGRTWRILYVEKPYVVLSTGAMIAFPALLLGKLMKKKVIFIECMFNVDAPTLTGMLAYRFADLFIVQWEEMLKVYPNAVMGGRVF